MFVNLSTMFDLEQYHQVLPIASLMEYVALNITKSSQLVTKARISKALALSELGYINEAYRIYKKILLQKNLHKYGDHASEFADRNDGAHFHLPHDDCYFNDLTPEHDKNQPAIQFLLKPIEHEILQRMKNYCTPFIVEMLQFLRTSILVRVGENQNVENLDKADARRQILKNAEDGTRASLASLMNALTIVKLSSEIH